METERYLITLVGLDANNYTIETIANIWDVSAAKIYEETGFYITGEIYTSYLVSDKDLISNLVFIVESKRNPSVTTDKDGYLNAHKAVIEEVRERVGNPRMDLTIEKTNMTYFTNISVRLWENEID
jgi:hypothetical protein